MSGRPRDEVNELKIEKVQGEGLNINGDWSQPAANERLWVMMVKNQGREWDLFYGCQHSCRCIVSLKEESVCVREREGGQHNMLGKKQERWKFVMFLLRTRLREMQVSQSFSSVFEIQFTQYKAQELPKVECY